MNDKQTLTLEAGKFYETRDGRKAFVAGLNPFKSTKEFHDAAGYIEGNDCEWGWRIDGRFHDKEEECDIVAEWVVPKRIIGHVFIYETHAGTFGAMVGSCPHKVCPPRAKFVACIKVDVPEGHGLNWEAA